jgi:hypothetical protein
MPERNVDLPSAEKSPRDMTRDELLNARRLSPSPGRGEAAGGAPFGAVSAGKVTVDQYLALREVPEHRRAARRAFAGELRVATIDEFDRLFAGVAGPG